jgi:hypothetical protein
MTRARADIAAGIPRLLMTVWLLAAPVTVLVVVTATDGLLGR